MTDGDVDFTDVLTLLAARGDCVSGEACPADLDMSGSVGFDDLLILLASWGDHSGCVPHIPMARNQVVIPASPGRDRESPRRTPGG